MLIYDHTLTDAEIKALPTTPISILAVNPAKAIVLHASELILDDALGAYTNISGAATDVLTLYAGLLLSSQLRNDALLGFATKTIAHLNSRDAAGFAVALATRKGADIELRCVNAGGDFTGGNAANTLRVTLYYNLIVTG